MDKTVSIQNPYLSSVRQFEAGNLNKTKKSLSSGGAFRPD
jgi:hypothetical protein